MTKKTCCTVCYNKYEHHTVYPKSTRVICINCEIEQYYSDACIICCKKFKTKYTCKRCFIFDNNDLDSFRYFHCDKCNICHSDNFTRCTKCDLCYDRTNQIHDCGPDNSPNNNLCVICMDKLNSDLTALICGMVNLYKNV